MLLGFVFYVNQETDLCYAEIKFTRWFWV